MRRYRAFHKNTRKLGEVTLIDFVGQFVKAIPCDFECPEGKNEIIEFENALLTWGFEEIELMEVL